MKFTKTLFIFSLSALALTVVSCDPAKEFEAEIKSIDSCLAELDTVDQLYQGIKFDSLEYMIEHIMENEEKMKKYYSSDTIDMELGIYMNNCKGVRKSMSDLRGNQLSFGNEIAFLDTQFTNLKTDILNGVHDKEDVKKYLAEEKDALTKLSLSFFSFYDNQKNQSAVFYIACPKVDEYVEKLVIPDVDSLAF